MKYIIQPNDIPLLAKIFCPTTNIVYVLTSLESVEFYKKIQDKLACKIQFFTDEIALNKRIAAKQERNLVLINLRKKLTSDWSNNLPARLVIIDFTKSINSETHQTYEFDFINNREHTIRWMYEAKHQKPIFLNLYNASGWKGKLFTAIFKIGFALKLKKGLKSGSFSVLANQLFLEKINEDLNDAQYAIFTGTVGVNRKAVISYEEAGKATQFLKMPLTKKGQKLVAKEAFYLAGLQKYTFDKLVIPVAKKIENSILVSNVKPNKSLANNRLRETHLLALAELYQQTTEPIFLKLTPVWQTIQEDLANIPKGELVNDLCIEKVQTIHTQLNILAEQFEETDSLPMAIAHGDLTPWNSYLSHDKLHVYDWELAVRLPLLYDAFHYIFQTSILVERLPFAAIQLKLAELEKDSIVQSILSDFKMEFQQVYHFYLLRNTSYYLNRYLQQADLHRQAHWLVNMWKTALADACSKISAVTVDNI